MVIIKSFNFSWVNEFVICKAGRGNLDLYLVVAVKARAGCRLTLISGSDLSVSRVASRSWLLVRAASLQRNVRLSWIESRL
jgi:hypothetical protein